MSTTTTTISVASYISLFVSLFAIMNPFGNAAIFLGLTSQSTTTNKKKVARTCTNAIAIILIVTVWVGTWLLELFGISISALKIAGGVIVILIGLNMLSTSTESSSDTSSSSTNVGVVPLAIPLVAGPGAMATILAQTDLLSSITSKIFVTIVCVAMAIVVRIIFALSGKLVKWLGTSGLNVVTKIMGLILCGIAVQLLINGLTAAFPVLA